MHKDHQRWLGWPQVREKHCRFFFPKLKHTNDVKIIRYIINVKQFAKFVVDLADSVAPTDIEEGMRVGVDRNK